jgi:integrase
MGQKPFTMPGRQAKTLSSADVNDLLVFASCTRNPLRNRVIVLLSAKAGLRAGEIANLTWDMLVDANGQFFVRYCFADPAHADAFRDRFGGERLTGRQVATSDKR